GALRRLLVYVIVAVLVAGKGGECAFDVPKRPHVPREGNHMSMFATKSLTVLMKEAQESGEHSLKRTLGPFQLTALGVGAIIGAGIFVLSGLGAHYAGPGLMLSFVLSGLG